jgi:hypothetical protein
MNFLMDLIGVMIHLIVVLLELILHLDLVGVMIHLIVVHLDLILHFEVPIF